MNYAIDQHNFSVNNALLHNAHNAVFVIKDINYSKLLIFAYYFYHIFRKSSLNIIIILTLVIYARKVKWLMMMEYGIVINAITMYVLNVLND